MHSKKEKLDKFFNSKYFVLIIVLFFFVYLILGLLCADDYGIATDEKAQRRHSLVNYKYINKVLFDRDVVELESYPDLEDYGQLYGVALQLPMVFIEDLNDFSLTTREIINIRHICTFLIVYVGYIFFFFFLKNIFGNLLIPFCGTVMISLYPRFFAIQYVDIKNLVFAATCMIALFFLGKVVQERSLKNEILFGVLAALATNTRIMGVVFLAILEGYFLISDINCTVAGARKKERYFTAKEVRKYVTTVFSFALAWYAFTPKAWKNPLGIFGNTFSNFSNYTSWDGTMVFMGKLIKCDEMPWYYLPVWMGISIPVLYLVLFFIAHIEGTRRWIKEDKKWESLFTKYKWLFCSITLFWGSVLSVIILKSRIYVGWHHMYFVYVFLCVIACCGLQYLLESPKLYYVGIVFMAISFLFQVGWIAVNHPCEGAYFNLVGSFYADQFDREEWQTSGYEALQWILENEEGTVSVKGTLSDDYLDEEEIGRLTNEKPKKYIISCYRNVIGNDISYEGYEEVYYREIYGYKVYSVFKRIESKE